MSNIVQGGSVSISRLIGVDYIPIACADKITLRFTNELIGKSTVDSGIYRKKRVRWSDVSISINGLMTLTNSSSGRSSFDFITQAAIRAELTLRITYEDEASIVQVVEGTFLVESVEHTGTTEGFAEYDIQFAGGGDFVIGDLPSPPVIEGYNTQSDWWQPSNGATSFSGAGYKSLSFAGHEIIEVIREMGPPLEVTTGTPTDRQYKFDGTSISIYSGNPFNGDEKVFVIWQEIN